MDMRAREREPVHLPVRTRRTVECAGPGRVETEVFCPLLARSTALDLCEHCTRHRRVENGGAAIVCDIELARDDDPDDVDLAEAAASTYVGEILPLEPTCVREDVSAELVLAVLNANRRCVPVVTAGGGLVGVVCPGAIFRGAPGAGARPTARDLARPIAVVLTEDTLLAVAIGVLAHSGEPELPVLSSTGAVTGMLRCADVVSWMAGHMRYAR